MLEARKLLPFDLARSAIRFCALHVAVEIECQRPTKTSDLDNRTKAALDALNGLAWEDDRQVVDLRTRWAAIEGCRITVRQHEAQE